MDLFDFTQIEGVLIAALFNPHSVVPPIIVKGTIIQRYREHNIDQTEPSRRIRADNPHLVESNHKKLPRITVNNIQSAN